MAIVTNEQIQFNRSKVWVTVWIKSHRDHLAYTLEYADGDLANSRVDADIAELCALEHIRAMCQDALDAPACRQEMQCGDFHVRPVDRKIILEPLRLTGDHLHNARSRVLLQLANEVVDTVDPDFNAVLHERYIGHQHDCLEYTANDASAIAGHMAALHDKTTRHASKVASKKLLWKRQKANQANNPAVGPATPPSS